MAHFRGIPFFDEFTRVVQLRSFLTRRFNNPRREISAIRRSRIHARSRFEEVAHGADLARVIDRFVAKSLPYGRGSDRGCDRK